MSAADTLVPPQIPGRGWTALVGGLTAAALVLLFVVVPHTVSADGYVRFEKLDSLLRTGTLRGERFSYIGPLFAAPLWLVAEGRALLWWCARFNVLVLAAACGAAWLILRRIPGGVHAPFALLLVGAGTLPNAARDFYGELFSAAAVGTGLLLVTVARQPLGWVPVVLGVANMPAAAAGLGAAAVVRAWRSRRFDASAALLISIAIVAIENTLTRGTPFDSGYAGDRGYPTVLPFSGKPGFSYPIATGVLSLLFSFGKGLLFFAPGLLLVPRARRLRPDLAPFFDLAAAFLAGLVLVYASWWSWYGGWTWGPRFLVFASYPASLAIAAAARAPARPLRAAAVVGAIAWSFWVGVSGAVFDLQGLETCIENRYALEHLCWYVPEFSPLFRHLVMPPASLAGFQIVWMIFAATAASVIATSLSPPAAAE